MLCEASLPTILTRATTLAGEPASTISRYWWRGCAERTRAALRRCWSSAPLRGPEFDSDICGEGRVGEISLSSREEASPGAGVCLRGLRLA